MVRMCSMPRDQQKADQDDDINWEPGSEARDPLGKGGNASVGRSISDKEGGRLTQRYGEMVSTMMNVTYRKQNEDKTIDVVKTVHCPHFSQASNAKSDVINETKTNELENSFHSVIWFCVHCPPFLFLQKFVKFGWKKL